MPDAYCEPCKARGAFIAATRIVAGPGGAKTPKCDVCFRGALEPVAPIPRDAPAERIFRELTPIGRDHPETHHGPKMKTEEAKPMPAKKEIDWTKVQNERSDGATVAELAKKYGCSTPTICAHTKGAPGGRRASRKAPAEMPAGRPRLVRDAARGRAKDAPSGLGGQFGPAIGLLKARRDELNDLISRLEDLNTNG